jgi:methionyl-tRNA formyltransferase
MRRKIALFASGEAGLTIAKFLADSEDDISILYLSEQYPIIDQQILDSVAGNPNLRVVRGDLRENLPGNMQNMIDAGVDTIITVYWPFILPNEVLKVASVSVNFHPALLPLNRGWYPHVHNLIDGTPAGVTLHKLAPGADEGDIWVQKTVEVNPWDCADDLYKKLQNEITNLFIENWILIKNNEIVARPQEKSIESYHAKNEIAALDKIDLNKTYTGAEIINLLRARTFGDRGFSYFESGDHKIFIRIKLEKN